MGFPFPVATRCRGQREGEAGKLPEAVTGFRLDDPADADEFSEGVAERLGAHAACATQIVESGGGLEIGERGLDALRGCWGGIRIRRRR